MTCTPHTPAYAAWASVGALVVTKQISQRGAATQLCIHTHTTELTIHRLLVTRSPTHTHTVTQHAHSHQSLLPGTCVGKLTCMLFSHAQMHTRHQAHVPGPRKQGGGTPERAFRGWAGGLGPYHRPSFSKELLRKAGPGPSSLTLCWAGGRPPTPCRDVGGAGRFPRGSGGGREGIEGV